MGRFEAGTWTDAAIFQIQLIHGGNSFRISLIYRERIWLHVEFVSGLSRLHWINGDQSRYPHGELRSIKWGFDSLLVSKLIDVDFMVTNLIWIMNSSISNKRIKGLRLSTNHGASMIISDSTPALIRPHFQFKNSITLPRNANEKQTRKQETRIESKQNQKEKKKENEYPLQDEVIHLVN